MRTWIGTLCIFILLQLAAAAPQEQTTKASIEGVITRSDNGEPIAGAQVTINAVGPRAGLAGVIRGIAGGVAGGPAVISSTLVAPPAALQSGGTPAPAAATITGPPPQIAQVTTDGNGKFQFKDLNPGIYQVIATATGFVRQSYGQRTFGDSPGTPIELAAGQSFKNAAIQLTATGTVIGRIYDDTGQPAIGVPVLVLQYSYDQTGLKTLRQTATGNANDLGQYRIYGITPGHYYVAMGNGPGPLQAGGGASGQPAMSYAFSFYPGVNDVSQASIVDVKSGGEAIADMRAVRQKHYNIRGRVIDSTGQMVPNSGLQPGQVSVNISLSYNRFGGSGSFGSARSYDPATGKFEFLNVIPGSYVIQAQMSNVTPLPPVTGTADIQERIAAQAVRPFAELPIVVQNADLENLVLTFATPVSVSGKLVVESQQLADIPGHDGFRLQIRRFSNGSQTYVGIPPQPQPFNADGTFKVVGLRAGEYLVSLFVPSTYFVKSLEYDGKDILGKPFEFSDTSGNGFTVVLGSKPGQVSGTLTDAKMQPAPGVQVVLIPDGKRDRADLYRSNVTDSSGRFNIAGIAPGNYKAFAWEGLEPFRYFDPDFMKTHEAKGKSIVVGESANVTATVQVIPLAAE